MIEMSGVEDEDGRGKTKRKEAEQEDEQEDEEEEEDEAEAKTRQGSWTLAPGKQNQGGEQEKANSSNE